MRCRCGYRATWRYDVHRAEADHDRGDNTLGHEPGSLSPEFAELFDRLVAQAKGGRP